MDISPILKQDDEWELSIVNTQYNNFEMTIWGNVWYLKILFDSSTTKL